MPIIKSAKKAARQAEKRTANNQQIKKSIKTALKAFRADPTAANLSKVQSEYDKAAKKGLLKKNTASRRKAALVKYAKAHANVQTTVTKAKANASKTAKKAETEVKKAVKTTATKAKSAETKAKKVAKDTEKKVEKTVKAVEKKVKDTIDKA